MSSHINDVDEILKRSATDAGFRTRLLSDPRRALEEAIGVPLSTLPRAVNLKFIEKEAGVDAVFVLPDFVHADGSLSDAELEAVAGGVMMASDDCCITCDPCCITEQ
jgi:hypothetical protein